MPRTPPRFQPDRFKQARAALPDRPDLAPPRAVDLLADEDPRGLRETFQQAVLADLSGADRQQLSDVIDYLHEHATKPGDSGLPEGGVRDLVQRQPPAVRAALARIHEHITTARHTPFTRKRGEADNAALLGLDPAATQLVVAALDGRDVADSLQERMSETDRLRGYKPPGRTRRDDIADALAGADAALAVRPERTLDGMATALTGAGDHLTLRDALSLILDQTSKRYGDGR